MKVDLGWLILVVGLVSLVIWRLSALASRIDRLHHRIELARATLDGQLLRRARATEAVASSGLVDPVSSMVLARAANHCVDADPGDQVGLGIVESELSRDLREVFADPASVDELRATPEGEELLADLAAACNQVALSRRFLNDGVQAALLLRRGPLVRWFRLAGRAPRPQTFEMDDSAPASFAAIA